MTADLSQHKAQYLRRLRCCEGHDRWPEQACGYAMRAEAEAARIGLVAEFHAGTYTEPNAATLDEWLSGGWWTLLLAA